MKPPTSHSNHSPTSFTGAPSLPSHRGVGPAPARVVEVVGGRPVAGSAATITVSRARRILLNKAVVMLLRLQPGQRIDLVPGQRRGQPWLLDTRSRTGGEVRLRPDGKAWLTLVHHIGPEHFLGAPINCLDNQGHILNSRPQSLPTRTLVVGKEDPSRPGIYLLHPSP